MLIYLRGGYYGSCKPCKTVAYEANCYGRWNDCTVLSCYFYEISVALNCNAQHDLSKACLTPHGPLLIHAVIDDLVASGC
jgi:hypothetical protein